MEQDIKNSLNLKIEEAEKKYSGLVEEFKKSIQIMKRYVEQPSVVADEILNSDLIIKDDFKDIAIGLKGTFTKAKALDMGKKKILSYITGLVNEIKQNKIDMTGYVKELVGHLRDVYDVVYNNTDIQLQERRKDQYMSHYLYTDLFRTRLNNHLLEYAGMYGCKPGSNDLLFGFREVLSMLSLYNTDDVDEKYKKFLFRTEYIANNFLYLGTNQFKQDVFQIDSTMIDKSVDNMLAEYIEKIEEEQDTTEDVLNILNTIIGQLDRTLGNLKDNIDKVEEKLMSIVVKGDLYDLVLDKVLNELIVGYSNAEITASDFVVKLKDSLVTMDNLVSIEHDLRIMVYNVCSKFKTDLEIYSKIYDIVNELTYKGSMTELKKKS